MKLPRFDILVNETSYYNLFTSIRDSNILRGVQKFWKIWREEGGKFGGPFLENPAGREVIRQIPFMGVVWIFSRTTQYNQPQTMSTQK